MTNMVPSAEERAEALAAARFDPPRDTDAEVFEVIGWQLKHALADAFSDGLARKDAEIKEAVEREREANCRAIRDSCEPCSGTGGIGGGIHIVTREMAMDACDPDAEGMEIEEPGTECEYCGRPIAAIRACGEGR